MTIFAKDLIKKIVILMVTISILLTFFVAPSAYAKLDIEDGEFYYSGTTKGTYVVTEGIFAWLLSKIGDIADWLIGIMTMGFRMVFVGWTALIEKLLTWALETTTGVNLKGELVENSTDLTALTDSSNNVTVEAIVYNKVPALDVNFFKKYNPAEDLIKDGEAVSGTGAKLVCENCGKPVNECMAEGSTCICATNEEERCDPCSKYMAAIDPDAVSIIQMIKDALAEWYYVMRIIAMAAMLVILIGIGIKMAISTVASEKAVYKRMLVDWVVGMIILVGIHYMMLATFTINEALVNIVHDTANKVNAEQMKDVQLMTLSEESGEARYTNNELEIKVYEEIRTRAYDPKLTVGLTGMIMYMTLVYFAIRYTIVYVKRYLTLMVLALMGPGLGVAYAMQKVFSGKSPAYSTWLKEFIMNTFIQSVHAILYAIFVSQALILSLDSLAGMIIALVFLNFTLKADKLFRKIFKMGEGDSLLGRTADAGDPDNMKQPFNAVKTFMKADATKQVAKTLMNTPYAKAIKGAGKVAVAGVATAATGLIAGGERARELPNDIRNGMQSLGDSIERSIDRKLDSAEKRGDNGLSIRVLKKVKGGITKRKLDKNVEKAAEDVRNADTPEEKMAAMNRHNRATKRRDKVNNVVKQPNFMKIGALRFKRAIDVRNTFNISNSQSFGENAAAIYRGIFGTKHIDPKTGKKISDKNGIYSKLSLSSVMGLEDKDKKALKQFAKFAGSGLLGMAGMFVGMGSMVANPKLGLAMLAHGAYQTNRVFGLRAPNMQDYRNKKFTFSGFSEGALNNIEQTTVSLAGQELEAMGSGKFTEAISRVSSAEARLSNIERKRAKKSLGSRFKSLGGSLRSLKNKKNKANIKDRKLRAPSTIKMKGQTLAGAVSQGDKIYADAMGEDGELTFVPKRRRGRYPISNLGVAYDNMMKKFEKEEDENFANVQKEYLSRIETFKEEAGEIRNVQLLLQYNRMRRKAQQKARREMQGDALKEEYGRMGFEYDPATGKLTRTAKAGGKSKDGSKAVKPKISQHDLYVSQSGKKNVNAGIRNSETVEAINAEFDKAVAKISNGRKINLNDKVTYAQLVGQVEQNLRATGILGEKQEVGSLFKKGQLRKNLEAKASYANTKLTTLDKFLERGLSKDEAKAVKTTLFGMMGDKSFGKDVSQITAEELFDKMSESTSISPDKRRLHVKDGSKAVTGDGSVKVASKDKKVYSKEDKEKIEIIEKYLKALQGEDGEYSLIEAAIARDNPYVEERAKQAKGALERILDQEYSKAGLVTGASIRAVSMDDIDARNIRKRLSVEDVKKINSEVQAAVVEVGRGHSIDLGDKEQYKKVVTTLTKKLRDDGILSSFQNAEVIFKEGKLQEIVEKQAEFASKRPKEVKQFLAEKDRTAGIGAADFIVGVDINDIDEDRVGRTYSTEELLRINVEVRAALVEVADGKRLDLDDRRTKKDVMYELTERLYDAGLINEDQTAEDVFKKGTLENILREESTRTNAKVTALDKFLDTALSDDEVHSVREIVSESSEQERRYMSAEDLYEEMRRSTPATQEEVEERRSMYREELDDVGLDIDEKTHEVVEQPREIEPDSELDIYTKHLIEAYALQGMIYDPKTGTVREDPDKAETKTKTEEEESLVEVSEDRRITDVDRALAHSELDAIIMELANGDLLDIDNEKTIDEILRRLSNRLGKAGMLESDEVVTQLFTRASLKREIKYKTKKANTKIEASKKYLEEALSAEEVSSVRAAIESLSEKSEEGARFTAEDVSQEMSAQGRGFRDEPAAPVSAEPDSRDLSTPAITVEEKIAVVGQYLSGMQEEMERAERVRSASERVEARTEERIEADKADKVPVIEQYLESRREEAEASRASREVARKIRGETAEPEEQSAVSTKRKIDQIIESGLEGYAEEPRGNKLLEFIASAEAMMETGGEMETGDGSKVVLTPDEIAETSSTLKIAEEMISINRKQREKAEKKKYLPSISALEAELNAKRDESLYQGLLKTQGEDAQATQEAKQRMEATQLAQELAKRRDEHRSDISGPVFDIGSILLNEQAAKRNRQRVQASAAKKIKKTGPGTKKPGNKA